MSRTRYVAVNHNGTPLCEPTTRMKAQSEGQEYTFWTDNGHSVMTVKQWESIASPFQIQRFKNCQAIED